MIRRDDESDWLLISQVDHARLAAEIASVWGNATTPKLPHQDLLLAAISAHDEGWAAWEQAVEIHPETGEPRSFTEMRMAVSTKIWADSINYCLEGKIGKLAPRRPLPAIWVSKHFCWLAETALANREHEAEDQQAIDDFLAAQQSMQQQWRQELNISADDESLEVGFRWVQFFDRLSLWLCCEPRETAMSVAGDVVGEWTFTPETPSEIVIDPFPLSVERLELNVKTQRIPAKIYFSDEQLHEAIAGAEMVSLSWNLRGH